MFFPDYEDHIIMTGTTTGGRSDVLVDRLLFSPIPVPPVPISYSCDIHYSLDESESFDDIAVTKNFVVVSTRRKLEGLTVVDFWHFKKPTSIGDHIFYPNFGHLYLASPAAESPVILEHISADRYAAAYKIEGYPVYTRMTMVQADASIGSVTNSVEIFVDNNLVNVPMDLKYNGEKDVLDILARRIIDKSAPDAPPLMHIYHVTQDVINHIAPMGDGTIYPNNLLWSIDPTKSSPYFVASGSDYWFPRYFKYLTDQWKNCPVPFEYRYEVGKPEAVLADKKIEWTWCKDTSIKYERDPESMAFPWICPAK